MCAARIKTISADPRDDVNNEHEREVSRVQECNDHSRQERWNWSVDSRAEASTALFPDASCDAWRRMPVPRVI